jgi:hypothetical protein
VTLFASNINDESTKSMSYLLSLNSDTYSSEVRMIQPGKCGICSDYFPDRQIRHADPLSVRGFDRKRLLHHNQRPPLQRKSQDLDSTGSNSVF